jgi:hypothetical protein
LLFVVGRDEALLRVTMAGIAIRLVHFRAGPRLTTVP